MVFVGSPQGGFYPFKQPNRHIHFFGAVELRFDDVDTSRLAIRPEPVAFECHALQRNWLSSHQGYPPGFLHRRLS